MTMHRHPGSRAAASRTIASPWSAPISSSATPSSASVPGSRSSSRRTTSRPSGPPSSASAWLERQVLRQAGQVAGRHVRQVGADDAVPRLDPLRQQVPERKGHPVRNPVPGRVLARQLERIGGYVGRVHQHLVRHLPPAQRRHQRHGDRPRARAHVGHPQRRGSLGSGRGREPGAHDPQRRVHEELRLGSRDQRPRVRGDRLAVELAEAADVGHRLAALPPDDCRLEGGPRPVTHERLRVRQDPGPIRAHGLREQQLRVQARRAGARDGQALGGRRDQGRDGRDGCGSGHRGYPPVSVRSWRRSAWSAICRASIRASIWPSSTPGTLWMVTPMRWSVTRLSGKL